MRVVPIRSTEESVDGNGAERGKAKNEKLFDQIIHAPYNIPINDINNLFIVCTTRAGAPFNLFNIIKPIIYISTAWLTPFIHFKLIWYPALTFPLLPPPPPIDLMQPQYTEIYCFVRRRRSKMPNDMVAAASSFHS